MSTASEPVSQPLRALNHANAIRIPRARLKRRVNTGEVTVAAVILDPPPEGESMALAELLMSQPLWGVARCRRFLVTMGLREEKTVGSLTERQRRLLADALADPRSPTPRPCFPPPHATQPRR